MNVAALGSCDDDGLADGFVERLQDAQHFVGGVRIEVAGRFVGHDERGVSDESARDGHALFLAAGKLARQVIAAIAQADQIEGCIGLLATFLATESREEQRQFDVLKRRQHRDQVEGLKDEPDVLVPPIRQFDSFSFASSIPCT